MERRSLSCASSGCKTRSRNVSELERKGQGLSRQFQLVHILQQLRHVFERRQLDLVVFWLLGVPFGRLDARNGTFFLIEAEFQPHFADGSVGEESLSVNHRHVISVTPQQLEIVAI